MIEFGVNAHVSLDSLSGSKKAVGSKPCILFLGDQWESDTMYTRIQNLLLDFFRGDKIDMISLKGVDHVIACTSSEGNILIRTYAVGFRKSGTKVSQSHSLKFVVHNLPLFDSIGRRWLLDVKNTHIFL